MHHEREPCIQACKRAEQAENCHCSDLARARYCSARLSLGNQTVSRTWLGSAERPNSIIGLGSSEPRRAHYILGLGLHCSVLTLTVWVAIVTPLVTHIQYAPREPGHHGFS